MVRGSPPLKDGSIFRRVGWLRALPSRLRAGRGGSGAVFGGYGVGFMQNRVFQVKTTDNLELGIHHLELALAKVDFVVVYVDFVLIDLDFVVACMDLVVVYVDFVVI